MRGKLRPETKAKRVFDKIRNESFAMLDTLRRQIGLELELRRTEAEARERNERKRVFNPDNIEAGDKVALSADFESGDDACVMEVVSVGGTNGNKVYCEEIGHELYATCFTLVRKHDA